MWHELARIYRSLGEYDAVNGIVMDAAWADNTYGRAFAGQ
jgi:hypothetical protein